jgi:hypothetical protein
VARSEHIDIIVALKELSKFLSDTKKATDATKGVGTAAEQTGKKAGMSWKSLAKWGGAATAVYGATRFVKGAVSATEDLAKSTLALQRQTNLDTKTASEWVGVLKERKINTKSFQMGLVTLSKQMVAYGEGSKTAAKNFAYLSIGQDQAMKSSPNQMLMTVADRLKDIEDPALRATEAQKLFGRAGLQLLPILLKGRKGIQELLGVQGRYGNYLSGKNAKDTMKLIEQQREMKAAMEGVKIQLGTALMPVLTQLAGILVKVARAMAPLTKNATLFKIAIGALVVAFIAYKVAMIAAAIATGIFETAAAPVVGIVLAIVAGLALLAIGVYLVIKHWGWFKAKLLEVWKWIKANWPLLVGILLGPIGLAVSLIIKNWSRVKQAFVDAWNWVRSHWPALKAVLLAPFTAVLGIIKTVVDKIKSITTSVTSLPGKLASKIPGASFVTKHLPHFQHGGVMPYTGSALVGEAGPEVLTLPRGAAITPMGAAAAAMAPIRVEVPLFLDKREIARAVATVASDKLARR